MIHLSGAAYYRIIVKYNIVLHQYLRFLWFEAANDIFEKNAWFFRNTLAWANYTNQK